jgi:hypothetical protein
MKRKNVNKNYVEVGYGLDNPLIYTKEELKEILLEGETLVLSLKNNIKNAMIVFHSSEDKVKVQYDLQLFINSKDVYQNSDETGLKFYICKNNAEVLDDIISMRITKIESDNLKLDFGVKDSQDRLRIICRYSELNDAMLKLNLNPLDIDFDKVKKTVTYGDPCEVVLENKTNYTRTRK